MVFSMLQIKPYASPDEQPLITKDTDPLHETFNQNVSHELRTPLAIFLDFTDLLHKEEFDTLAPEQEEATIVILDRDQTLHTLVERITILLSSEAKRNAREPLALSRLFADIVEKRRPTAVKPGLTLTLH